MDGPTRSAKAPKPASSAAKGVLQPAHNGHLGFIRDLIREGAALGSFDSELSSESPAMALFFANLEHALRMGYLLQADPISARARPVHASGYVYRISGTDVPMGFGLFKEFGDDCFELWLLAISAAHRALGHGRAMLRLLMATPVGQRTLVARCKRGGRYTETAANLFAELGFVPQRTTPGQIWMIHRRAPEHLVDRVAQAPLLRFGHD